MDTIKTTLHKLGLSESEVEVYLAMNNGALSAHQIMKVTNLKRPTVYYALNALSARGLVSKGGVEGYNNYQLEPLSKLRNLSNKHVQEALDLEEDVYLAINSLDQKTITEKPRVAFFEGIQAVQNAITETLYCREKQVWTMTPETNFFHQLGGQFLKKYVEERKRRKVTIRGIWEKKIPKEIHDKYYTTLAKTAILPKGMHEKFKTTLMMHDDKVLYISSKENGYALLVQSQEHRDFMNAMYEEIWKAAKK